ncbi:MAG: thrombospondin type 3 repeat-containing protein, partial [Thiolinea sp.]
ELDDDNDGVKNSADKCPTTVADAKVNEAGCELDDDNDGVKNSADQCPNCC